MTELERLDRISSLELKEETSADGASVCRIEGYASLFGEMDSGRDIVMPGAFAKSLKERRSQNGRWRIPMFFGHVHNSVPVGVWDELVEDKKGLKVVGRIILASDQSRQLSAVMRADGEMGISIGYKTIRKELMAPDDGPTGPDFLSDYGMIRKLLELDLREISLVPLPMLESARVESARVDNVKSEDGEPAIPDLKSLADSLVIAAGLERLRALFD